MSKRIMNKNLNVAMSEVKTPFQIYKENAAEAVKYVKNHMSEYDFTVNLMCPLPKGKNNVDIAP